MTKEDKELLLKELCARFPYGVKIQYDNQACKLVAINDDYTVLLLGEDGHKPNIEDDLFLDIEKAKPYLRPMSSMTEEEKHYIDNRWGADNYGDIITYSSYEGGMSTVELADIIGFQDWLNAHHFDYRGLISKGLVIEAPENMYKEDK